MTSESEVEREDLLMQRRRAQELVIQVIEAVETRHHKSLRHHRKQKEPM